MRRLWRVYTLPLHERWRADTRTIVIRTPAGVLATETAKMRKWLDARTCEPSRFTSHRYGNILTLCVEFNKDGDGEAFKAHSDREKRRQAGSETWGRMADDLERRLAQTAR